MWQPFGKVSGASAFSLVSRRLPHLLGAARGLEQRDACGRCRPPRRRRSRYWMSPSDASSRPTRPSCPSSTTASTVRTMAAPAHIAEREPTEAKPVSPTRCRRAGARSCVDRCRARRRATRPNTVAWLWPVDCTLQPRMSLSPPGKSIDAVSVGMAPACSSMQETPMPRSISALRRLALALVEVGVVGERERLVDDAGEVAAVVGVADRGLHRHRRLRNQVLLAQPHRIHADDARGLFDHALQRVVRLRPAGAAIGADRHRVGEIAGHRHVDLRECGTCRAGSARNCWC